MLAGIAGSGEGAGSRLWGRSHQRASVWCQGSPVHWPGQAATIGPSTQATRHTVYPYPIALSQGNRHTNKDKFTNKQKQLARQLRLNTLFTTFRMTALYDVKKGMAFYTSSHCIKCRTDPDWVAVEIDITSSGMGVTSTGICSGNYHYQFRFGYSQYWHLQQKLLSAVLGILGIPSTGTCTGNYHYQFWFKYSQYWHSQQKLAVETAAKQSWQRMTLYSTLRRTSSTNCHIVNKPSKNIRRLYVLTNLVCTGEKSWKRGTLYLTLQHTAYVL